MPGQWKRLQFPTLAIAVLWLTARSPLVETQAASSWPDERAAGPFFCHADFPLEAHVDLLDEMARLQRDLTRTLGVRPAGETIHLFLFRREPAYRHYVAAHFPNVPYRRALFVKERGPGMIFAYRNQEFEIDLRHEGTHALLHAALPMVPLWLDEGLAEYFEVPAPARAFHHPNLNSIRWSVRFGKTLSLERLEQIHKLEDMGQNEYRQAWAWVHFLLHGSSDAHAEFVRYLEDIQSHTPPGILSQRLKQRLPDIEQQLAGHFGTWRP